MTNLEKSEVVISRILDHLLEAGIQNNDLRFASLDLEESYYQFFLPCFDWLQAEGLVRSLNVTRTLSGGGIIISPTITSRGLELMGKSVSIDGEKVAISTIVKQVSRDEKSYSGLGDFVGGILGGFTKSVSS